MPDPQPYDQLRRELDAHLASFLADTPGNLLQSALGVTIVKETMIKTSVDPVADELEPVAARAMLVDMIDRALAAKTSG